MNEKFARWHVLFLEYLKRDWKKITVWIVVLASFCGGFVPAFVEIAKGQGAAGMFETMKNPAMIAMVGPTPVKVAADYTVAAMYAHEMLLFCALFAMIISAMHVVSHTRKEEELGLTELVRSFRVGRQANSLAVIVETVLINIVTGVAIAALMISFNATTITAEGSFLFGAAIAIGGIMGGVIALVMAQIMPAASGATGLSLSIIGLLYILRAGTDVTNLPLSKFNPMAWLYLSYPFTKNVVWPLLLGLAFSCVLVVISFALEGHRDMGAGYLPEHEGRATAKKSLLSVLGLFIRLNFGVAIAWLFTFAILGAAYGSIYGDMQKFLESNAIMKQMFAATGSSIEASFTATIMIVMTGLAAILPVVIVNKLFSEESRQHLSQLFATKVSRAKFYWTTLILAVVAGVLSVAFSAGGLGVVAESSMGKNPPISLGDFMAAGFNFWPFVLFCTGLAALALGWWPKAGKAVYAYIANSFMLNYFGRLLNLRNWFLKTALQSWIPQMPVEKFDLPTFVVITLISCVMIVVGYIGYKKRDLIENA